MGKVIGIDLGTTNSCMAVMENQQPVIIPSSAGGQTTPSVVAFTKNGERLVGSAALRQAVTNPDRTIRSVKRQMGSNWSIDIDGTEHKPQTISAMILMQLKKEAEEFFGEPVTDAVITVPAYFNDVQRQATKDAGKIAGLNVKRIINEPTSAALAYGLDHGEAQKVLVFDLGGGTFDVSVIEIGDDVIEVLATAGDNHLGGDDFDEKVLNWAVDCFKREHGVDLRKDPAAYGRVKEAAEQAKKELSTADMTQINLPYLTFHRGEPVHMDLTLTRTEFNRMTQELIERLSGPVNNALSDAGIAASELGQVLLVGGSTRIPAVQDMVRKLTGKEPSRNINPDECVAKGAAILGNTLSGDTLLPAEGGNSLLLLDVIPLSLSIETVGGVATRLIERNTTLPARYSQVFSTVSPYQRNVDIHVLQGERPMAKDNKTIGRFTLKGIKRAMAGVPQIEVTFDIDTNGILKVSAKDLDTGKEQSITVSANDRMSEEEIQKAIFDAQAYASVDHIRKEALELLAEGNTLLAKTRQAMKEKDEMLEKSDKKQLKNDCSVLEKQISKMRVDKVKESGIADLRLAIENLRSTAARVLPEIL
ncbi:MAG: molecular chaperone DnaK [Lachnospiraceae bacterium]|nr:molecular chaperone DnaK [Lachnospiraceae bacterium]